MGFIIRMIKIIVGLPILSVIFIASYVFPALWASLLLFTFYYLEAWALLIVIFLYVAFILVKKETPSASIGEVTNDSEKIHAFTPETLYYYNLYVTSGNAFFASFITNTRVHDVLIRSEIPTDKFLTKITPLLDLQDHNILTNKAFDIAKDHGTHHVEVEHLFLSSISLIENLDTYLLEFGSNYASLEAIIKWLVNQREVKAARYIWQEGYKLHIQGGVNIDNTGRVTPYLDKFSDDLTKQAEEHLFKNFIKRQELLNSIAAILGSKTENVLLIGEAGSGKTTLLKLLAQEIVTGTKYEQLKYKRLVKLNTTALLAGISEEGVLANRIKLLMEDVEGSSNIIVCIDDINELMESNINTFLIPYLSSKNQFIATTTRKEFKTTLESKGSFNQLFNQISVGETTQTETMQILQLAAYNFEQESGIIISYPALLKVIELSNKLIKDRIHPDRALYLLNRVVADRSQATKFLGQEDVALEISKISKVPIGAISTDESDKLLNLESIMSKIVIGQDTALKEIASAMKRARVGIRDEKKPIASFLFVGTTGIGKTQTAKALAQSYFGDSSNMIRFDMSEYQQPDSINRLLGTSDGKQPGQLTEVIKQNPFSLILLDEIEKADSKILLTFLQVLDDGRLTDASGTTVDFSNTIIIATSNIGTRSIQGIQDKKGSYDQMKSLALSEVAENFAPEFLNRFTDIIVFKPLSMEQVKQITNIMLDSVRTLASNKGLVVSFSPELIEELAKRSYNPQMGARPLARTIEEYVETYLADKILRKELNPGDNAVLGVEVFNE